MMMGNREGMINTFESKVFQSDHDEEAAGLEDSVLLQVTIFFYNKDCIILKMQSCSCSPLSCLSINGRRAARADGKASYGQEGDQIKKQIPLTRITEFHSLVKGECSLTKLHESAFTHL